MSGPTQTAETPRPPGAPWSPTRPRSLVLFVVGVCGCLLFICNAIPQIKVEAAVEVTTEIGELSPRELIALGKTIFSSDRAQCLTCHTIGEDPKARCPNQEGLGERAGKRKPGMSGAAYLVESTYNPNAYIVSGYPSNQMSPVNRPPIALGHDQILAVIAFLNSLGGTTDAEFIEQVKKAQDPWRRGVLTADMPNAEVFKLPIIDGDVARGREQFIKWACLKCHRVGAEGKDVCPDLTNIGASQSADYILESLLDPSAVIVKGYKDTIVFWKDGSHGEVRGTVVQWLPSKERPTSVVLNVVDDVGERVEETFELGQETLVGDTTVLLASGDRLYGEYIDGDEQEGLQLRVFDGEGWSERTVPRNEMDLDEDGLALIGYPASPMPADFSEQLTPREVYDLLSYLRSLKGNK